MLRPAGCKEFPELDWNGLNVRSGVASALRGLIGRLDIVIHSGTDGTGRVTHCQDQRISKV